MCPFPYNIYIYIYWDGWNKSNYALISINNRSLHDASLPLEIVCKVFFVDLLFFKGNMLRIKNLQQSVTRTMVYGKFL